MVEEPAFKEPRLKYRQIGASIAARLNGFHLERAGPRLEYARANDGGMLEYCDQRVTQLLYARLEAKIMSDPDAALIFLHIPKTAGSSLSKIIKQHYSKSETATLDKAGIARFKSLPAEQRARYRLIQGHLYFGLHRFIPRASTYVTFLRHPIERALSFYYYARTTPDHYLYPVLTSEDVDLNGMLARDLTIELQNHQTRMLAGNEWQNPQCAVTRTTLERAQENLRSHFRVVGLQEEFDASLLLLHRAFGWPVRSYARENVTEGKPREKPLDIETQRLLEEKNSFDLELYAYARNLFEEQCRTAGDSFAADLREMRKTDGGDSGLGPFHYILRWAKDSLRSKSGSHLLAL